MRLHLDDCDAIIVHDPQPLPLITHFPDREIPWFWQCHIDLSSPYAQVWTYLRRFIEQYNAAIFSLPEYGQDIRIDQQFVTPAIDPFSAKNRELSDREIREFLGNYKIPTDRPLVTQISRFDRWKDPMGVIEAFQKAREQVDCTLVLVGNNASDEPAIRGLARLAVQVRTAGELTVWVRELLIPRWWKADANCPGSASGRKRSSQALRRHRACGGMAGRRAGEPGA